MQKKVKLEGMNLLELEKEIELLTKKKQDFERNRTLCVIVFVLLAYYTYQGYKNDQPAFWFYILMVVLLVVCAAICYYDTMQVKKYLAQVQPLEEKARALRAEKMQNEDEGSTDYIEDDDSDDEAEDSGDGESGESDE